MRVSYVHNLNTGPSVRSLFKPRPVRGAAFCLPPRRRGSPALRILMPLTYRGAVNVTSRNHASLRRIRDLRDRAVRVSTGRFVMEGVRFLAQAASYRATILELVVSPQLLTSPTAQRQIRRLVQSGTTCYEVPPEVLHSLSAGDDPQGVIAVVRQEWIALDDADPHEGLCWVALSGIRSAGNLGTLIRTAESVGAAGLILVGECADPYDPACVRATMGASLGLRYARTDLAGLLRWKHRCRVRLIGTSPGADVSYRQADYGGAVALFLGGERKGLSEPEVAACDQLVRIPMVGRSDSLNVAVAGAVALYQILAFTDDAGVREPYGKG
jgi:TrmH family RNA methyltransferase